jgi:tetratricopeptide (TPR) repeat protein
MGSFDSALTLRKRTIELRGSNFTRLRELGRCYLQTGRISEAIESLEKAMAEYQNIMSYPHRRVLLRYELGQAYEAAGRTEDAIEQYQTFLDIWKNADEGLEPVEDAKERLARLKNKS